MSVWKDNNNDSSTWSVSYYIKNFKFRFEHEPETRYLSSEEELNRWLTFRFLTIRDNVDSKRVSQFRKSLEHYSFDKDYLIDIYNRWLDNNSDEPMQRNAIIEKLVSQAYDYIFDNDSGNRVFAMIMHLPSEKRRLAIGR